MACRYVPMFGQTAYRPQQAYAAVPLEEQLEALGRAVEAGKVRQVGLSNETPWGLMECCRLGQPPRMLLPSWSVCNIASATFMIPYLGLGHASSLRTVSVFDALIACLDTPAGTSQYEGLQADQARAMHNSVPSKMRHIEAVK